MEIRVPASVVESGFWRDVRVIQDAMQQMEHDLLWPPTSEELDRRQVDALVSGRAPRREFHSSAGSHGLEVSEDRGHNHMRWDVCGWQAWLDGPQECEY